jgi:hypothetical protein
MTSLHYLLHALFEISDYERSKRILTQPIPVRITVIRNPKKSADQCLPRCLARRSRALVFFPRQSLIGNQVNVGSYSSFHWTCLKPKSSFAQGPLLWPQRDEYPFSTYLWQHALFHHNFSCEVNHRVGLLRIFNIHLMKLRLAGPRGRFF